MPMFTRGCVVLLVLSATACGRSATPASPSSAVPTNVTLTFNGVVASGTPVAIYSENGFSVSANLGSWATLTTYGNPAPFIEFNTAIGEVQVFGTVPTPFTFKSLDLYSSVTPIPYTITGRRGISVVFTLADTLPNNTLGQFRTVVNPHGTDVIDTLTVSLSNSAGACCLNPMGLDNIVLSR